MSQSARLTLIGSVGVPSGRSASWRLLSHAYMVFLCHLWIRGVIPSVLQSLKPSETMSDALPRLPPLIGVRRMMASMASNHLRALASSSSVSELAALWTHDSTST